MGSPGQETRTLTCKRCGLEFPYPGKGRPRDYCTDCHPVPTKAGRGSPMTPTTPGPDPPPVGPDVEANCPVCGSANTKIRWYRNERVTRISAVCLDCHYKQSRARFR